jgi:hypothetical protein
MNGFSIPRAAVLGMVTLVHSSAPMGFFHALVLTRKKLAMVGGPR